MTKTLKACVKKVLSDHEVTLLDGVDGLTIEASTESVFDVLKILRDDETLGFDMLIDVCGVDYTQYGCSDWETEDATFKGFSRGVEEKGVEEKTLKLAVVYHLLSLSFNRRIRVRAFCDAQLPVVKSVCELWQSADWFEREAYDLFGILFEGHVDLRRILTDYGFIGHPFRKSFPVSGHVEMRYDAAQERVVYEPVDIEPRVLVPRVVREDSRYLNEEGTK
jgi:NADH-quinone oxidoreductase subunit C